MYPHSLSCVLTFHLRIEHRIVALKMRAPHLSEEDFEREIEDKSCYWVLIPFRTPDTLCTFLEEAVYICKDY